jgi:hypothetical protein
MPLYWSELRFISTPVCHCACTSYSLRLLGCNCFWKMVGCHHYSCGGATSVVGKHGSTSVVGLLEVAVLYHGALPWSRSVCHNDHREKSTKRQCLKFFTVDMFLYLYCDSSSFGTTFVQKEEEMGVLRFSNFFWAMVSSSLNSGYKSNLLAEKLL